MTSSTKRVAVWSTGGVGGNAIRAVARRPDLELVGVWVHSPDKVGRDVGDLAGIDPLLTTMSRNIHTLRLIEVSLNDHYPVADVMMDGLGFARDLGGFA